MMNGWTSLLWFLAVLALIPVALWMLKRSPLGSPAVPGVMRTLAVLPIAPGQKLVTVEVGTGAQRRWLVLGVTASRIATLHAMEPGAEASEAAAPAALAAVSSRTPSFAQLLQQLRPQQARERRHAR